MVKILINDQEREVEAGLTVIQALEQEGIQVPRFCYHEKLQIAGNCRMCLVEIAPGPPKPQASCAINVAEGMSIKTETPMVKKAREGVMEFLLANHPLDCPICDQAGECDLQDQAFVFGKGDSVFKEGKRAVEEKAMGPFIKTQMTRCIHCTRCVRFMEDIAGTAEIGAFGRGNEMEIATFLNEGISSELSGNIVDLCPVGALTAKPYAYTYRPWELKKTNSIDLFDALGSPISLQSKGNEVVRVLPRINEEINEEWLSDKSRFAIDGMLNQRLDACYIKNAEGKLVSATFDEAFEVISKKLSAINLKTEFASITGNFTDIETIGILKNLMEQIGSTYHECRQTPVNIDISSSENYIFNSKIAGIEEADFILIVGSNPRKEAPVLNARIRRNAISRKIPVYLLGEEVNLTYKTAYLGNEKAVLSQILNGNHPLCEKLSNAKKPMIIVGLDAFSAEDGLNIHHTLLEIADKFFKREDWNGFNILHKNASLVGALDAKFTYEGGIEKILEKCENGEIKAVYALGADEIDASKLKNIFLIYQGSHGDKLAQMADVILPATSHTEKAASFTNTEGRVQQTTRAVLPIGIARDDQAIVKEFGKILGFETNGNLEIKVFSVSTKRHIERLDGAFKLSTENFYLSDYISRNSESMAKAKKELS